MSEGRNLPAGRRRFSWFGVAVTGVALLAACVPARTADEWVPGKYMTQAVTRVMGGVREIDDKTDYGYDTGTCVLGAYIQPGAGVNIIRTLKAGEEYVFLGGGADPSKDVDLELFGPNDQKIAEDTDGDATPVLLFTPKQAGDYTLRISLVKSPQATFCALAILRDGGWDVPIENLTTAVGKSLIACNEANKAAGGVRFHEEANTWSLFGFVLPEGTNSTLSGMTFENRSHFVAVTADDNAKDLDLYLLDNTGKVLAEDTDPDPHPMLQYKTGKHPNYGMRVENNSSKGPTMVIATILDM